MLYLAIIFPPLSPCDFLKFEQRKAVPTKASDGYFRHYGQNVREVTFFLNSENVMNLIDVST